MNCQDAQRFLPAYMDGEFEELDRSEIERHVETCEACRGELVVHAELKQKLRASTPPVVAPGHLKTRVRAALRAEEPTRNPGWWSPGRLIPILAGGTLLVLLTASSGQKKPTLAEAVRDHTRDLPVDVPGPDEATVANWFRGKVEFPVLPPLLKVAGSDGRLAKAQLLGGRLHRLDNRDGAYLQYYAPLGAPGLGSSRERLERQVPNGHKISVFVYDPKDAPLEAPIRQRVGNRDVFIEERGPFRSAMFEDRGVGYVVTADLDRDNLLRLVTTGFQR
jgi:anti-sigma factor RsiW